MITEFIMDDKNNTEHHHRFHLPHLHLSKAFGGDWFGTYAEKFARFSGTAKFLIIQSLFIGIWILANSVGWAHFDIAPFILLNLLFSIQSAYSAPMILLAQTRQADRDTANSEADAKHREELAVAHFVKSDEMKELIQQNIALTAEVKQLHEEVLEIVKQFGKTGS
jgi:uncharacterized membrane protein